MGTWGPGNFENDGALDYLGDMVDGLVQHIEECFENDCSLDELGESELMPTVHILALLCDQCNVTPPKLAAVQKWKRKYLKIYDKEIDGLEPDEQFKIQRRETIDQTFVKLERIAQEFEKK